MIPGVYTIVKAYRPLLRRWGLLECRWVPVPKPQAELEPDPQGEKVDEEGNVVTYFRTKFGVRFARVVEPTGFVMWMQEVNQ